MARFILVVLITSCLIGTAVAQSCESKAVSAEGKPASRRRENELYKKMQAGRLRRQGGKRGG